MINKEKTLPLLVFFLYSTFVNSGDIYQKAMLDEDISKTLHRITSENIDENKADLSKSSIKIYPAESLHMSLKHTDLTLEEDRGNQNRLLKYNSIIEAHEIITGQKDIVQAIEGEIKENIHKSKIPEDKKENAFHSMLRKKHTAMIDNNKRALKGYRQFHDNMYNVSKIINDDSKFTFSKIDLFEVLDRNNKKRVKNYLVYKVDTTQTSKEDKKYLETNEKNEDSSHVSLALFEYEGDTESPRGEDGYKAFLTALNVLQQSMKGSLLNLEQTSNEQSIKAKFKGLVVENYEKYPSLTDKDFQEPFSEWINNNINRNTSGITEDIQERIWGKLPKINNAQPAAAAHSPAKESKGENQNSNGRKRKADVNESESESNKKRSKEPDTLNYIV